MPQKNFPAPPRATLNLWGSLPSPVKREPVLVLPVVPVVQKVSTAMNSIKVRATASIRQVAPGPPPAIRTASSPPAPVILQAPPKPSEFPALTSTTPRSPRKVTPRSPRKVAPVAPPAIRVSSSVPALVTLQAAPKPSEFPALMSTTPRKVAPEAPPAIRVSSSAPALVTLQAAPKPSEFPALMSTPPLRRAVTGQALPAIRMSASPPAAPVTLQAPPKPSEFPALMSTPPLPRRAVSCPVLRAEKVANFAVPFSRRKSSWTLKMIAGGSQAQALIIEPCPVHLPVKNSNQLVPW